MILQQLYKDAPAILGESQTPSMYDRKPVKWIIPLTCAGEVAPFIPLGGKRGELHVIPYLTRTSNVHPILLADTAAYVLGVALGDRRAADKHSAFKALVRRCAQETGDPMVCAVDAFLSTWKPDPERVNQLTG
ncbi:MAG TPA: type I-C CRISPR-associated protein Cas8c/Csd1, partial [Chthonomonadales bacterium]|nr:type I-C CRISPR-associated protein Cas8c/Csd1 [Chthonomonadales bacterium]